MMILCYKALCFVANFSAPSLLKSELVPCVLNLVGHCVSSQPETSCCCFLSPCFSYKGNLFTEEYGLLRTLSGSGCCVDASFQLLFDIKSKTESWQTSSNIKKHVMISFNKVEIWGYLDLNQRIYFLFCNDHWVLLLIPALLFIHLRMPVIYDLWHTLGDSSDLCLQAWSKASSRSGFGVGLRYIAAGGLLQRQSRFHPSKWWWWRACLQQPFLQVSQGCMGPRSMRRLDVMQHCSCSQAQLNLDIGLDLVFNTY